MKHAILAAACAAGLALGPSLPASAGGGWTNASTANAAGRCQSALPVFEQHLRNRPLAVQNDGGGTAFVTCSYLSDQANDEVVSFGVYARATGGAAITLTCTAVVGYDSPTPEAAYVTKTLDLEASGVQDAIYWYGSDFGGTIPTGLPVSLSCSLPPGAALNDMYFNYVAPGAGGT